MHDLYTSFLFWDIMTYNRTCHGIELIHWFIPNGTEVRVVSGSVAPPKRLQLGRINLRDYPPVT